VKKLIKYIATYLEQIAKNHHINTVNL